MSTTTERASRRGRHGSTVPGVFADGTMTMAMKAAMTVPQVAEMLATSERQVQYLIKDGSLPYFNVGRGSARRSIRISDDQVAAFVASRTPKADLTDASDDPDGYAARYAARRSAKGGRR